EPLHALDHVGDNRRVVQPDAEALAEVGRPLGRVVAHDVDLVLAGPGAAVVGDEGAPRLIPVLLRLDQDAVQVEDDGGGQADPAARSISQRSRPSAGATRAAGNSRSPARARASTARLSAPATRKRTSRAALISGSVKVRRRRPLCGAAVATTRRSRSSSSGLPGESEAVWATAPPPRRAWWE